MFFVSYSNCFRLIIFYHGRDCSYTLYNISNFVGLQAVKSNHSVVTYEVMLSIQRLVGKYGVELQDPAWDLVLSIIEAIISYVGSFFFPIMLLFMDESVHFSLLSKNVF